MNTSVPRSNRDEPGRAGVRPEGDWLDDLVATGAQPRGAGGPDDHRAGMRAIADQMARIGAPAAPPAALNPAVLRAAVAEIARRQAMLDDEPVAAREPEPAPADVATAVVPQTPSRPAWDAARPAPSAAAPAAPSPFPDRAGRPAPAAPPNRAAAIAEAERAAPWMPAPSGLRRAGIDLSAEVSQTFARFSRDIMDAINAADVRPEIQALDRQVRTIGRTVEGLGTGLQAPRAPAEPTPEVAGTLAEMRGLLDSFKPGAALSALETRIDGLAKRLERESGDPAVLIEGLSRRVDEIHHSLRTQLAQSVVDTKPIETLVRDISDRIGQARATSTEFEQLEAAMRDVAARIDRVPAEEAGHAKVLEDQLARIGERLDRSEASLRAIDGVEHSLGELFSQFEVTRQVAIDAAEMAARTAARDTLRAALQAPGLQTRAAEPSSALAEQMARGIEDLRAMQEIAQRRTQDSLVQIQEAMDRLARHMAGTDGARPSAAAAAPARRPEGERSRAGDLVRAAPPADVDTPIEPGFGRSGAARTEPRFDEALREPAAPPEAATAPVDGDGPASFIAAARRAAQAAQASAASAAALKAGERRSTPPRKRAAVPAAAATPGASGRAGAFLARRRRPLLLGLAALVMLVGALEVVNLGLGSSPAGRTGMAESVEPDRPRARTADMVLSAPEVAPAPKAAAPTPAPAPAPSAAAAPPSLPTFVAGAAGQPPAASGIPGGLKALAGSGDAAAQYEVGLRYADGRGVERDPKEAIGWFGKAAAQGLAPAEYRLGSAYEKGVGVDRDPTLAMSWYGKAAEAGNVRAMHNLAVMAAEGAAGKPDYAKAAQWFQKASSYGVRDSEFNLAILYARGLGIEQSLEKSYMWFAVAASAGDEDAAKKRDEVGAKLDAAGLAAAKAAAAAFKPQTPSPAANEVAPPAGGWDAVGAKAPTAAPAKVSRL